MNSVKKTERIDIRVSPEEKAMLLKAQALSGERTITSFISRTLRDKAEEIIEKNQRILSSERDKKIFFDAVFSGIEPNSALKKAAKKYNKLVNNNDL